MKLKLMSGVSLLVFLLAFSCTTKKPSKFKEVSIFRGSVTEIGTGEPIKNALVRLTWPVGTNCTCKPGNIIECIPLDTAFTLQVTNSRGEYNIELSWDTLGFLFAQSSDCQMQYTIEVDTLRVPWDTYTAVVDTAFPFSLQDRSVPQVFDFQIP